MPMDFTLTEEELKVQQLAREFTEKEIAPTAKERDEKEDWRAAFQILKKMGKVGLLGLPFPKQYGGAEAGQVAYALASMEVNKACGSMGCQYSVAVSLSGWPIFTYGNEEQRQKYSTKQFTGEYIGAFGFTEPGAGSDSAASKCTAEDKGDYYLLNGTKCFITNSGPDMADIIMMTAMTDPSQANKGISGFIVHGDWEGLSYPKQEQKMGIRSTCQSVIEMNDLKVPKENLLGKEGQGFQIAMTTLDGGRIGIAAQGVGLAMGAYNYALQYAQERVQFNKPIFAQQAISFKLADMATKIEMARTYTLYAAWLKENHMPYSYQAAMAKKFATNTAMEVTTEAVQILGGHGFLRDHPVERMMRDAKITQIYEGTNEIQNLVIGASLKKIVF